MNWIRGTCLPTTLRQTLGPVLWRTFSEQNKATLPVLDHCPRRDYRGTRQSLAAPGITPSLHRFLATTRRDAVEVRSQRQRQETTKYMPEAPHPRDSVHVRQRANCPKTLPGILIRRVARVTHEYTHQRHQQGPSRRALHQHKKVKPEPQVWRSYGPTKPTPALDRVGKMEGNPPPSTGPTSLDTHETIPKKARRGIRKTSCFVLILAEHKA